MDEKFETLKSAKEYLPKLIGGVDSIVEFSQNEEYEKASKVILEASEGFQWIIDLIGLTKDTFKEEVDEKELVEKFSEVVEALENEDHILVSDLFEYEVKPILEGYLQAINNTLAN